MNNITFGASDKPSSDDQWHRAALLGRERSTIPAPAPSLQKDLILLDRDGTLNRLRPGYVSDPDTLDVLPEAARSVRRLNELGARVMLVTNQRGIARGQLSEDQLVAVHLRLINELAAEGARLDGIHVCPHEEGECDCRKPRPGLIDQVFERSPWASRDRTVFVGDSDSDQGAAHNAGIDFVRIDDSNLGLVEKIEKVLALCNHFA